jgi:hypothetical protein
MDAASLYDDAVPVDTDWGKLAAQDWNPPALQNAACSYAARQQAI